MVRQAVGLMLALGAMVGVSAYQDHILARFDGGISEPT